MNTLIILISLFSTTLFASEFLGPEPFSTDYCTSYPEGTRSRPNIWKHCCEEHDLYFWAGGSKEDRKVTDLRLRSCVEATGEVTQARLIYSAVTLGGRSPIRFKTRQWGNAFPERVRYQSLTLEETHELLQALEEQNPNLSVEIKQNFKSQLLSRLELR